MASFVTVAKASDLKPGQGKAVEVNGKTIALFNADGTYYAMDDTCTHVGGPLSEGELDGPQVTCPLHGSIFNVTTGEVLGPPAARGVTRYNTRVEGDDVEVEV